jgi:hypothetical protein
MSITGNAATVTTNANLSGAVTSSGSNVTAFGSQSAGVLGSAVAGIPSMQATSTLYGAVQNGKVLAGVSGSLQYVATTTAGTGLTYTGSAFNVNTSQNIATLSNLTTNGLVNTSSSNGTLGVTANGTAGFVLAMSGGVPTWVATSSIQNLTLTTTGTSGAATLVGNTLNIPQYTGGGAAFPFTPTTNFGQLANATTTALWLQGSPISLMASSSVQLATSTFVGDMTLTSPFGANTPTFTLNGSTTASNLAVFKNSVDDATLDVRSTAGYGAAYLNLFATAAEYNGLSGWVSDSLKWRIGRSGSADGLYIYTNDGATLAAQFQDDQDVYFPHSLGIGTTTPTTNLSIQGNQYTSGTSFFGGVMTATSTVDFSAAVLKIPTGTNPTADDPGELAHDTTDNQLILDDAVVGKATERIWGVTVASTSPAFISGGLLAVPLQLDGYTITAIRCYVLSGTSKVIAVEDASANSSEDITCATTSTSDDGSITNATYTAAELSNIDFGATNGAVDYVTIAVFGQWTRE